MTLNRLTLFTVLVLSCLAFARSEEKKGEVKQKSLAAPNGLTIKVRLEGPYDADTPLQVVCYFKHRASGDKTLGAAVELDKKLGGVIASLRNRGEFVGEELETLLLVPPKDTIKPRLLLLVGLGEEESLSLDRMERIGRVALREAVKQRTSRCAFAPLIRDQGNSKLNAGDVEQALITGLLLAYDTEKRLQKEGLARPFSLDEWAVEAGPAYFDDTVGGVEKGIKQASIAVSKRAADPYRSEK